MRVITESKPLEEIKGYLGKAERLYLIGCGTCTTLCETGGEKEVEDLAKSLSGEGFMIIGTLVLPTVCDLLTLEALSENGEKIEKAEAVVVLSCALGVQRVSSALKKPVFPGVNSLFLGLEFEEGFLEVCQQCGDCVLGFTAGICPVVRCAKGLLNGPCGGSHEGKCEVSSDIPCAWIEIYERLREIGREEDFILYRACKDWSKKGKPGRWFKK